MPQDTHTAFRASSATATLTPQERTAMTTDDVILAMESQAGCKL
jgi:hypothetical protein